jgi:hypothetical protein
MKKWIRCIVAAIRKGIWFPLAVFVLHEVCSHICGNLYNMYPPLDIPMHFLGGIAIAYFGAVLLKQCAQSGFIKTKSDIMYAALILAITLSAATIWEYAEWISDHTIGTQSQKSLDDTLFDTFVGLLGGCLYVLISKGRQILTELSQQDN